MIISRRTVPCGLDWRGGRRAFVLYVWDNYLFQLAGLHRAVSRRDAKHGASSDALPLTFDVGDIETFVGCLKESYPEPRYAIRDWLAGSMLDFFQTRYNWTEEDFDRYRPRELRDPFEAKGISAPPPLLCDYRSWLPSNRENETHILGHKSGQPFDQKLFEETSNEYVEFMNYCHLVSMRQHGADTSDAAQFAAYLAERKKRGFRTYNTSDDIPDRVCVITARLRIEARWSLFYLLKHFAEPSQILVPREEKEMLAALRGLYPPDIVGALRDPGKPFFYEGRIKDGRWRLFVVRHHKMTCSETFVPELIHESDA